MDPKATGFDNVSQDGREGPIRNITWVEAATAGRSPAECLL